MTTPVTRETSQLTNPAVERHVVRRGIAAVGLVNVALIHLLDVPGKLDELVLLVLGQLADRRTSVVH